MSGAGRRAFSCGPPLLLFWVLLSSEDLLVVKLSPVLASSSSGSRGLLAASGNLVALRVLPML